MQYLFQIPVYNFPGWMLIMLYSSIYILIGRWWFKRSGYKPLNRFVPGIGNNDYTAFKLPALVAAFCF
jgi:hypothetical protein